MAGATDNSFALRQEVMREYRKQVADQERRDKQLEGNFDSLNRLMGESNRKLDNVSSKIKQSVAPSSHFLQLFPKNDNAKGGTDTNLLKKSVDRTEQQLQQTEDKNTQRNELLISNINDGFKGLIKELKKLEGTIGNNGVGIGKEIFEHLLPHLNVNTPTSKITRRTIKTTEKDAAALAEREAAVLAAKKAAAAKVAEEAGATKTAIETTKTATADGSVGTKIAEEAGAVGIGTKTAAEAGSTIEKVVEDVPKAGLFSRILKGVGAVGRGALHFGGAALGGGLGAIDIAQGGETIEANKGHSLTGVGESDGTLSGLIEGIVNSRIAGYLQTIWGGATTGAAAGSVVPGVGTVVGGLAGAVGGGIYALGKDGKLTSTKTLQQAGIPDMDAAPIPSLQPDISPDAHAIPDPVGEAEKNAWNWFKKTYINPPKTPSNTQALPDPLSVDLGSTYTPMAYHPANNNLNSEIKLAGYNPDKKSNDNRNEVAPSFTIDRVDTINFSNASLDATKFMLNLAASAMGSMSGDAGGGIINASYSPGQNNSGVNSSSANTGFNDNPDLSVSAGSGIGLGGHKVVEASTTSSIPAAGRALLDTISGPESEGKYNVGYNNDVINDLSHHPGKSYGISGGRTTSAAGKYQFEKGTWAEASSALGLKDFGPESQDKGAWWLAQKDYKRKTGRDLNTDVQSNDPETIKGIGEALHGTWTSLPGGSEQGISTDNYLKTFSANKALQQSRENATTTSPDNVTAGNAVTTNNNDWSDTTAADSSKSKSTTTATPAVAPMQTAQITPINYPDMDSIPMYHSDNGILMTTMGLSA